MTQRSVEPTEEVEAAYERFLLRDDREEPGAFERFTGEHPELEDRLRSLHLAVEEAQALLRHSLPERSASAAVLDRLFRQRSAGKRYTRLDEIARGGMATVYIAHDEDLGRRVAQKVAPGAVDPGRAWLTRPQARLLEEAQIAAQLDHPSIIPVHDAGIDEDGSLFVSMPLLRGQDFESVIEAVHAGDSGWSRTRALNVLLQVCEAVAYAHSSGVIHRDLKPSNVMVGAFGETVVVDWGLAAFRDRPSPDIRPQVDPATTDVEVRTFRRDGVDSGSGTPICTMDGDVIGTPAYMPPEQARGDLASIGMRSDVYALGAILYQLLTGVRPFSEARDAGAPRAVLLRVLAGAPRSVHSLRRDVPDELVAICEKAMTRVPEQRYESVRAMAADVRAFLERRVVRAHRTGTWIETRKWVARNRALAAAVGTVILGLAWAFFAEGRRTQELERSNSDLRERTYLQEVALANSAKEKGETGEFAQRLDACPVSERAWEWGVLRREIDHSDAIGQISVEHLRSGSVSPDGSTVFAVDRLGVIRRWEVGRKTPEAVGNGSAYSCIRFDPSGAWVAVSDIRPPYLSVYPASGGGPVRTLNAKDSAWVVAWSPDGTRLALGEERGEVSVWDVVSGARVLQIEAAHKAEITDLHYTADGHSIVTASVDRTARMWNASTGERVADFTGHKKRADCAATRPQGDLLATGDWEGSVRIWNLKNGMLRQELSLESRVNGIAWSDDGGLLAVGSGNLVFVYTPGEATPQAVLVGHLDRVVELEFDASGRLFSYAKDGTVRRWSPRSHDTRSFTTTRLGSIRCVDIARDGTTVAVANESRVQLRTFPALETLWESKVDGKVVGATFDASWDVLLVLTAAGRLHAYDVNSPDPREIARHEGFSRPSAFAIDPGGSRLVAIGSQDGGLRLADWSNGGVRWSQQICEEDIPEMCWTDAGIFVADRSGKVLRVDGASGDVLVEYWGDDVRSLQCLAVDPNGDWVVATVNDDSLAGWDLETGELRWRSVPVGFSAARPTFLGEGQRVVTTTPEGDLVVWNPATGRQVLTFDVDLGWTSSRGASSDGSFLVTGSTGGRIKIWDSRPRDRDPSRSTEDGLHRPSVSR